MKNLTMWMVVLLLIAGLMVGGCASSSADAIHNYNDTIMVANGDTVRFSMQEGRVRFIGKQDGAIEISGEAVGQFTWQETADGVAITIENKGSGSSDLTDVELEVRIPENVHLEVSTYDADILLEKMDGDVKAVSVAGDVTAFQLTGRIFLKSGRGNVHATDCEGSIRVLGEHGILKMIDLHGDIASGTIMGTVDFTGSIDEGDEVFLETDHGPVLVTMTPPVNMQVKAWTASGEVACMVAGLEQTVDGCVGRVGDGTPGKLTVKTVSGKIWMENAP